MNKKRIISVDGVRYSLDTGKPIVADKVHRPIVPTPSHETDEKITAEEPVIREPKRSARLTHFDSLSARPKSNRTTKLEPPPSESKPISTKVDPKPIEIVDQPSLKSPNPDSTVRVSKIARKTEAKKDTGDAVGLSHPTLPMPPAELSPRRISTPAIHVFFHPFIQRVDRRIVILALGRVLWSWRFWLSVATPFVAFFIYRLTTMTPNQILALVHRLLNALPYQTMLAIGLTALLLVSLSYYFGSQTSQIISALKLKQIDHRLSSARYYYAQCDAKLFRTLSSRTIHLLLFWGSFFGIAVMIYYLYGINQVYFETVKLPVLIIIGQIGLIWLLLLGMRWPMSRNILAATDQPLGSVESKSFSLVFGNFFKALGIVAFWSLISLLFLGAVGAIIWSLSTYLINDLSIIIKLMLAGVGICLLGFLFTVYTIWSMVFWASSYRVLIKLGHKQHLSDYLQIENPSKKGKLMLGFLFGLIFAWLIALGIIGYHYQDMAVATAKNLAHKLPDSLNNLVPHLPK